jgi:hypothetical protein
MFMRPPRRGGGGREESKGQKLGLLRGVRRRAWVRLADLQFRGMGGGIRFGFNGRGGRGFGRWFGGGTGFRGGYESF